MTVIYTGRPAPLDGMRKLSGREASQRAKAIACVRSQSTQCQGQVYMGLFFDGTGNNDTWVEEGQSQTQHQRNKHSNVARLFQAYAQDPQAGIFRSYLPGVGTPFPGVGDTSAWFYDNLGMGLGYMGAPRINYGIASILNAVHAYLMGTNLLSPAALRALVTAISVDSTGPLIGEGARRWAAFRVVEAQLAGIVKSQQRKVLEINVSIFGFSRGAAEARACAFWLSEVCSHEGGQMTLAGIPLRIGFVGIFDTVAAVGIGDVTPVTSGHMAWADGTQTVHPTIEDCAHFIALHEQRASFPLEAAAGRGNIGYPGMHSDVGGGYCPGEQGKAMAAWGESPHLSQIPLLDMHFAAIKAGVPMMTIEEIKADAGLARSFSTDPKLIGAYNDWLAHQGVGGGDIVAVTEAHARQYIRWRGMLHMRGGVGVTSQDFYKRTSDATQKSQLKEADDQLRLDMQFLYERKIANSTTLGYLKEQARSFIRMVSPLGTLLVDPGKSPLSPEEAKFLAIAMTDPVPPAASIALFDDYIHDSRAAFRVFGHMEPAFLTGGYFRFRHVFKEVIHAESPVYGWANQGLAAAAAAGNAVAKFFDDLWNEVTTTYRTAKKAVADAMRRAALQAASTIYQSAEMKAWRLAIKAEEDLYSELAKRYAEYNSPEARQRRQWDAESAEYRSMTGY